MGEDEIVSVDEARTDGARKAELEPDGYLSATYLRFPEFPALYMIWKAILRAIKGAWVGWGKLELTASVPVRA